LSSEPSFATAILDRLLHHSHVLTIRGEQLPAPRRAKERPHHAARSRRASGRLRLPAPRQRRNNLQPSSWTRGFM